MKVTPLAAPMPVSNNPSTQAQDARSRAIAKLTGTPAPQESQTPIPVDANNISPEEIKAVSPQVESVQSEQSTITEATEVPAPEVKAETKPEDPSLTDKYNLLARRERAIRAKAQQQERALAAKEAELTAKAAELQKKEEEYRTGYISKQRLKQSPLEALAEAESSYEELTQQLLNQQPTDPRIMNHIQKLEAKIAQLQSTADETQKNYINSQDQAYKAAVKQIRTDVENLVKTDPNFETVAATRSIGDVVELIEKTFKEDGVLLSVEEATQEVEDYLVEEATRLAKLSKIQKRMQPAPAKPEAPVKTEQQPTPQPQMKTLTNAATSTRKLSAKERAILAFKGELK